MLLPFCAAAVFSPENRFHSTIGHLLEAFPGYQLFCKGYFTPYRISRFQIKVSQGIGKPMAA